MSLLTKLKVLLVFVIINLIGYLLATGALHNIFKAPMVVTKNDRADNSKDTGYIYHQKNTADKKQVVPNTNQTKLEQHLHKEEEENFIVNKNSQNKFELDQNPKENFVKEDNIPNLKLEDIKPDDALVNVIKVDGVGRPNFQAEVGDKEGLDAKGKLDGKKTVPRANESKGIDQVPKHQEPSKKNGILSAIKNYMQGKPQAQANPHNFNYIINEPNKCKNEDGSDKDVFFLVLVCSVHRNFESRSAIRASWGSLKEINGKKIITMFLLAKKTDPKLQGLVLEESEEFHDILMEDFDDTYKNLTLKTVMGVKWASNFCPQAKFIMKTDDDMYVSYANIINHVASKERTNFAMGMVIKGSPIRDPKSKWYMPKDLYPDSKYPPFMSGTGYVMSGDVAPKVYNMSLNTPYLYLEDVYFAICLNKLHILPENHKGFNNWRTHYTFCKYKHLMTAHMVTPTEMKRYWGDQKTNKLRC